ncbi:hypothetical protein BDV38DRAFT_279050 [Aspergillus pseudotamarii]|uniref:SH3 domain-containing protein n=1 Tax=Aspergillus pseudotamarii TaxID=132259 RepID=A0A5N6T681_ASPPS|nr:uncharacterized protein BDV38DRAFT_279050 [Aspergillus pseudotamarii]KAE8141701.1 hypothetical protein BDV38DRAFT_279050 [Aspergillus pseudotamarii]
MQVVEASLNSGPLEAPRLYQPLASRVVQNWGAPSAAPIANGYSQNGQYGGASGQGSWSQNWGQAQAPAQAQSVGQAQSPGQAKAAGQSVAVQAQVASTALQPVATEDTGRYTWRPNSQTSQLQTSTLSQSTTTSQTMSTTSKTTTTSSDTTTTHSKSTSTNTQPTTLQTRVSHKATATATHAAATSTGTGHDAPSKLDTSGYAAIAVCAVVGLIAGFVLFSLYKKRRRATTAARDRELRERGGGPKSGHLETNNSLNTLPHLFLASKTALFSVVSLRSSNEKDDVSSDRSAEERQIACTPRAQNMRSHHGMVKDVNTPDKSHGDSGSISDASTVAGTPSRHPTFRPPTELNYDDCSSADDSTDDEASDRRPGIYRRLTERVANIRPARSKNPKRGHRHCRSAPNEIIVDGITSHRVELNQPHQSHRRRSTPDDSTGHSIPCHSPGLRPPKQRQSNNESRSTSDDDTDHATDSLNISRSTSGDDSDRNTPFQRPQLKTRGSFKEVVTGLAKMPRMASRSSVYKGSASSSIEEKDRSGAKLSTIPDDEDKRIIASYAPSTFKTYNVDMDHTPVNDTQIKLAVGQSVTIYQVYDHGWLPECKRCDLVSAADERLRNVAQLLATDVPNHSLL